jgi:hypothetical protein
MYIEPASAHAGNILESIDAAHHIVFRPQDLKEQEDATCGTDEYMADGISLLAHLCIHTLLVWAMQCNA